MPRKSDTRARAAQGAGSIRQRPDGRWEARCVAGHDAGTGKQIRCSIYGATQKEVLQGLKKVQAAIDSGTYTAPNRMTVGQWLDVWVEEYLDHVKPATLESYRAKTRNNIKPLLGSVKLQVLKPHHVQQFCNTLHRENNLSPKSVKCIHGILHAALKQAVKNGYIVVNPADGTNLPRVERAEIAPMPEDMIMKFIERANTHEYGAVYFVTLFTGMRQSEVLGLSWDAVDFERGILQLRQQLIKSKDKGGGYSLQSLKNDKPRTITPAPIVMQKLWERRSMQAQEKQRADAAWANEWNLVFNNPLGEHLKHVTVYKNYKRIVDELGIPALRFHDLRHTYAVNALRSGDDIKTVQGNLGHHTAAFTLDTYGHVTEQMQRDSVDRMQLFFDGLAKQKTG